MKTKEKPTKGRSAYSNGACGKQPQKKKRIEFGLKRPSAEPKCNICLLPVQGLAVVVVVVTERPSGFLYRAAFFHSFQIVLDDRNAQKERVGRLPSEKKKKKGEKRKQARARTSKLPRSGPREKNKGGRGGGRRDHGHHRPKKKKATSMSAKSFFSSFIFTPFYRVQLSCSASSLREMNDSDNRFNDRSPKKGFSMAMMSSILFSTSSGDRGAGSESVFVNSSEAALDLFPTICSGFYSRENTQKKKTSSSTLCDASGLLTITA